MILAYAYFVHILETSDWLGEARCLLQTSVRLIDLVNSPKQTTNSIDLNAMHKKFKYCTVVLDFYYVFRTKDCTGIRLSPPINLYLNCDFCHEKISNYFCGLFMTNNSFPWTPPEKGNVITFKMPHSPSQRKDIRKTTHNQKIQITKYCRC